MSDENVKLFTSGSSQLANEKFDSTRFDFKSLGIELINQILMLDRPEMEPVESIEVNSLVKGFNLEITGGGIYKIKIKKKPNNSDRPHVVLKSIPPFIEQQKAMFEALDKLGQKHFIDLLAQYPSNQLSLRELSTYAFLVDLIPIATPRLLLGILNQLTEQAWIFMEDVSELTAVTTDVFSWKPELMKVVTKKIADFHATFWAQDSELKKRTWIGNWWTNRNNDFVAEDVTTYALETCARLHPDLLTPARLSFIAKALKNRRSLHTLFQDQTQTLIHWDMGPHNMRLNQNQLPPQPIVFDWELTSIGIAQWDLAQFLMPILGGNDQEQITFLIDVYLASLPVEISQKMSRIDFLRIFDLVVLDHFFRVCGPIVFANDEIDDSNIFFREWKHCLEWIELRLMAHSKYSYE